MPDDELMPLANEAGMSAAELEALCSERQPSFREPFEPNSFYGNGFILKSWAGINPDHPLEVIVTHGVNLSTVPWDVELNHPYQKILCHSDIQSHEYTGAGSRKKVIPVGAPYLYASRLVAGGALQPSRNLRSVLAFPAHSTHFLTAGFEMDEWISFLRALLEFRPVTVCLYWRDVQLGHHKRYMEAGFPVVSCGHMYDEKFLLRLAFILRSHGGAIVNRLGSCAFYAASEGLDVHYFSQAISYSGADSKMLSELSSRLDAMHTRRFMQSFGFPDEVRRTLQYDVAIEVLGNAAVSAPGKLRTLLLDEAMPESSSVSRESEPVKQPAKAHGNDLPASVMEVLERLA